MPTRAVVSLTTGLEDPEKATVAFLVAVGAAEVAGTIPLWNWIGDEGATTFSY